MPARSHHTHNHNHTVHIPEAGRFGTWSVRCLQTGT